MMIGLGFASGTALYGLDHVDPTTTILAFCKIRLYIIQSTAMMYRWCFTIACIDRYALSSANARLRNFATVYIAHRVVIVIILIWIVLPVHILIVYNLKENICGAVYSQIAAF